MTRLVLRIGATMVAASVLAGCSVGTSAPEVVSGVPDLRSAVLDPEVPVQVPAVGPAAPPAGVDASAVIAAEGEVLVVLQRGDMMVWVPRPLLTEDADPVMRSIVALTAPLEAAEVDAGLSTDVPGDLLLEEQHFDGQWLELRLGGTVEGGTQSALRRRSLQIGCTALAVFPEPARGVNFVGTGAWDGASVDDCPPAPEGADGP